MILCLQISFQQHSITNAEISWHFGPHLTFLQGLDKLLSPPTSKLITKMLNSSPRTSAAQIRILENPWCKHHHLCLHREHVIWRYFIGIGLCPSLIVSTFNDREFIIVSFSVMSVCRDSSSKLCPCDCSKEFKIVLANLTWRSQIPTMWLAAGGFFYQVIQSSPWSWRKFSILLQSIAVNAFNNSCSVPTKLEPLSERICLTFPLWAINLLTAWMNESVLRLCVILIWTALLEREVGIAPIAWLSLWMVQTHRWHNGWMEVSLRICPSVSVPSSVLQIFL